MITPFEYNFKSHTFDSPGYLTCVVPDCVKEELETIVEDVKFNNENYEDARHILAGHLDQEYNIPIKPHLKYLIETLSLEYDKIFYNESSPLFAQFYPEKNKQIVFKYELKSLWINFSKKYEFNPVHTHSGAFSFVIWVNIPYNLDEELLQYSPNKVETSLFQFHYVDSLGKMRKNTLLIDKSWEWKMAFFPASLNHSVNPFYTSDKHRISISGNVYCVQE